MQTGSNLFLVIFLALLTPQLHAEVSIIDLKNVLGSVPKGNVVPFSQAFKCNQPQSFFIQVGKCQISCDDVICKDSCASTSAAPAFMQPEECTEDTVQIYSSMGHVITALRSDYERGNNTIFLTLLKQMENFYEPIHHINIIRASSVSGGKLIEGGKMLNVPTFKILFEVYPQENITGNHSQSAQLFEVELDLKRTGLDQLMYLYPTMDEINSGAYVFKRKGFIHALF